MQYQYYQYIKYLFRTVLDQLCYTCADLRIINGECNDMAILWCKLNLIVKLKFPLLHLVRIFVMYVKSVI